MVYQTLSNGYKLPAICYGTDIVKFNSTTKNIKEDIKYAVKRIIGCDASEYKKNKGIIKCAQNAIDYGCNFFDTSRAYGDSENMLKYALKNKSRESYFICTKLDNYTQLNNITARTTLKESMKRLGVQYVDVYLLHWPVENKYLDYWKQLEELYSEGLIKTIGVSNCKIHHLEEIKKHCEIMPMINEVEIHPLLSECELRRYCTENNIQLMAYTSTARMDFRLKNSRRLQQVCDESHKNMSQVILKWHIQNKVIPIFNTSSKKHFIDNMNIFDFELNEFQMKMIDSLNINARTRYDSDNCEWDRL